MSESLHLPLTDVAKVLADYVDEEIVPKATGLAKFGLGIAGVALARKGAQTFDVYAQTMEMLGLMDRNGVLIDDLRDFALESIKKINGRVEAFGIIFGESDIVKLHEIASKYSKMMEG